MISINHSDVVIELDENDGGRATSWTVGSHQLLGRKSAHPIDYGMYPMAPWAGRIRGNQIEWGGLSFGFEQNFEPWAIHGLVLSSQFEIIEHSQNSVVLQREFDHAGPTRGVLRCSWALSDEGLMTEIACTSRQASFPAVLGWHPWFRRQVADSAAAWSTDCREILPRGDDSLPTGDRRALNPTDGPLDDVLTGGRRACIEWPGLLRIDIENSQPWFVIFDALDEFVCIEPQTGPTDGLSGRLAPVSMVTPGHPLSMRTRWSITRGQQEGSA